MNSKFITLCRLLRAQASSYYEQLRPVDDMKYSMSRAQGSRCYEQLRVVDDISYFGS